MERQREGIAKARADSRYKGRKPTGETRPRPRRSHCCHKVRVQTPVELSLPGWEPGCGGWSKMLAQIEPGELSSCPKTPSKYALAEWRFSAAFSYAESEIEAIPKR